MNIDRISSNKIVSIYGKNKKTDVKQVSNQKGDTLEISSAGKAMSNYGFNMDSIHSKKDIEKIRMQINNGTYNRDSKMVAKKMIDIMNKKQI